MPCHTVRNAYDTGYDTFNVVGQQNGYIDKKLLRAILAKNLNNTAKKQIPT